jgi:hypothetical protein
LEKSRGERQKAAGDRFVKRRAARGIEPIHITSADQTFKYKWIVIQLDCTCKEGFESQRETPEKKEGRDEEKGNLGNAKKTSSASQSILETASV